jgi:polysaccharide export outer membrane protein
MLWQLPIQSGPLAGVVVRRALLALFLAVGAAANLQAQPLPQPVQPPAALEEQSPVVVRDPREMELAPVGSDSEYKLSIGDRIQVIVVGHEDLSGEFLVDGHGQFFMPLLEEVDAAGLNPAQLEKRVVELLKPDYLVNPRVNIQVLKYRPYYLMGEVAIKGAFPYLSGMTYLKAIAIAGGFTYRAKQDYVFVIRADDESYEEVKLPISDKVQPGDIIRVAERIF